MLFSMFMVGVWKTQLEDIQNHTGFSAIVVILCCFCARKPLSPARSLAHLITRESRGEKELELWTKIIPQHLFALFHMLHMVIRLKEAEFQKYDPI